MGQMTICAHFLQAPTSRQKVVMGAPFPLLPLQFDSQSGINSISWHWSGWFDSAQTHAVYSGFRRLLSARLVGVRLVDRYPQLHLHHNQKVTAIPDGRRVYE